jgi:hypothetical protein
MRARMLLLVLALGILMAVPAHAGIQSVGSPAAAAVLQTFRLDPSSAWTSPFTLAAMQQQPASDPPKSVDVDISVDKHEGRRAWYLNPVWMAIGGLGLALVIILIVMAARGGSGGTTVVRG